LAQAPYKLLNADIAADGVLRVYPNPVSSSAHLFMENDWRGRLKISVVNVQGQEIYTPAFLIAR